MQPGEFELIARLTKGLALSPDVIVGPGDDCAVLDTGGNRWLLATDDSQVEGVHFLYELSQPEEIGRKALAINISDIAAMGGEPRFALVSLVLPPGYELDRLERIYAGLRQEAEQFGVALIGGNISGTGERHDAPLIIDITLLGEVERERALLRSGARPGDLLCVTGTPGDAAAALYTVLHPSQAYPPAAREQLLASLRVPTPRVREGRVLSRFGPRIVTSMLDISDGLSGDLAHICERSNVGALLDAARLPLSPALREVAASIHHNPLDWVLHGGDAYELLFTTAPGHTQTVCDTLTTATGTPVTVIGNVTPPETGMTLVNRDGQEEPLLPKSWDHLLFMRAP